MIVYILSVFVSLLFIHYIVNCNSNALLVRKIPGPSFLFLIGHALEIFKTPAELFDYSRKCAKKFNGIYILYSFFIRAVNIYNPEDVEIITSNVKHHQKSLSYYFLSEWLGEGLLLSKGSKWHNRRKMLTPAFHFHVLRKYYEIIKGLNQPLLEELRSTEGEPINIIPILSNHSLNMICETTMGVKLSKDQTDTGNKYKEAIHELGKIAVQRLSNILYFSNFIFNFSWKKKEQTRNLAIVHSFTDNVIDKRNDIIQGNEIQDEMHDYVKKKKACMLDILLKLEKEGMINKEGIQEEVDTFMFEGHDTAATGLTFCLLALANEEAIQEKIAAEFNSIFGDDPREATLEDLSSMKYLELCIKEALRLYPPVPFIGRLLSETVTLSNYTVPAKSLVHIHIYDLHRNESVFKDAEKFDPDRFLPENSAGRHNYAYIPFSAGPRNCIGQKFAMIQLKSILSAILRNFKLVPVTRPSDVTFITDLVLRSATPIYVKFVNRNL